MRLRLDGDPILVNIRDPACVAVAAGEPTELVDRWPVSSPGPRGLLLPAVGLSYSVSMDWVNLGYVAHNGSFAVLGLLFLVLGGWLPLTTSRWAGVMFVLLGAVGLALASPPAFRWESVLPALPSAQRWRSSSTASSITLHGGRT